MANLKVDTVSGIGTEGPVLNGGLHFRSKNYLTLPKGTTTERTATSSGISTVVGAIRYNTDSNKMECYINNKWMIVSTSSPTIDGGARGLYSGRSPSPGAYVNTVDYITISTAGNAIDFGDQNGAGTYGSTTSDKTRGLIAGGHPSHNDVIDFFTIATTGDATDFGNLTQNKWLMGGGVSSPTRSVFAGGSVLVSGNPSVNTIEYVTTQSLGNAVDFGDHIQAKRMTSSVNSPTRGIFAGGYGDSSPYPRYNIIEFITTASTGNATDFGDLSFALAENAGVCNSIRGMIAGNGSPASKVIEVLTISTLGNTSQFGELSAMSHLLGGASSPIRGVYAGGYNPSSATNSMEYISLQTEGDSVDFGDLTVAGYGVYGLSNAHGGL